MNWEKDDIFLSKWLNGELSEEEKRQFESSEEGQDFVHLMKASTLIEPSSYDTNSGFSKLTARIQSGAEKKQKIILMQPGFQLAIAASVALIIAVTYLFNPGDRIIKTDFGEQEIVRLPDGSEVQMNATSSLSYDTKTWEDLRVLELDGEAFFKVSKGEKFEVQTVNGNVQVLGTNFNVKSRGQILDVTCHEGKLNVVYQDKNQQLNAGEHLRLSGGEKIDFRVVTVEDVPSWTSGITELENVSLQLALNELSYVFGFTIDYDGSLDHLIYTGAFPHQEDRALKLVLDPLNVEYSYDKDSNKLKIIGLKQ